MIKEWVPKQRTVLVRNPLWTGPQPEFDEIHLIPIEDEKSAELGFEAGDLDWTWVSVSSLPEFRRNPPEGSKLLESPSLYYVWLGMNVDNPSLSDIRVRKAIQRSIDVNAIMDAAYFGIAKPSTGIIAPGLLGHRAENMTPAEPDFEGARALLAEAGHESGLELTLDTLNKPTYLTSVQIIQANLAEIGIDLQINVHDSGTFWTLGSESDGESWKNIQLLYQRYSMSPDPSWATAWFVCDQVGVWNWERVCNEEFDDLHNQALVELDSAKRDGMYQRMQDLMEESGAYRFITHEATPAIYPRHYRSRRASGRTPHPQAFPSGLTGFARELGRHETRGPDSGRAFRGPRGLRFRRRSDSCAGSSRVRSQAGPAEAADDSGEALT